MVQCQIDQPQSVSCSIFTAFIAYFKEIKLSSHLFPVYVPGNHYGTPKPPREPQGPVRRSNSIAQLPSHHPFSEGRRKRTRSTNESGASPEPFTEDQLPPPMSRKKSLERAHSLSNLGPLPPNWEMAFTDDGQPYFIEYVHCVYVSVLKVIVNINILVLPNLHG